MRRTLLLCFIHGFKGDADTFGTHSRFSQELRQRVAQALPRVDVRVAVYPKYETRGDLAACVSRFVDWLLERVIDLEVAARTASPTVDPSVHCVLIGHSMGGIVAADALLTLVGDTRVDPSADQPDQETAEPELNGLMFPYVQGVLGFDTPYLGIAPGVVAHGAEGQFAAASQALTQITSITDALWGKGKAAGTGAAAAAATAATAAALPAPPAPSKKANAGASSWGWGKIALAAGAGVLASGAAAVAYTRRDQLGEGWSWATSHLEFVGCLARGEDLRRRMKRMTQAQTDLHVGFGNLYTQLGEKVSKAAAARPTGGAVDTLLPAPRTFCNLPSLEPAGTWRPAVNDGATDETWAHMSMFDAGENPNYATLLADARDMIVGWTQGTEWYEGSSSSNIKALTA